MSAELVRILVVDDDDALRAIFVRELSRMFEVIATSTPGEAIAALKSEATFAAVVTDLTLEPIDGIALLGIASERKPGAARILVTGALHDARVDAAVASGTIHRVIAKPWPPGQLASILFTVIESVTPA